jgi:transposase-like protein
VEDITEALWGTRVSPGTVSNLNKKLYAKIDEWRQPTIEGDHPYIFLGGIVMKRTSAGEARNVSLLVAIGVTNEGYREILGIMEGPKEDRSGWSAFLRHLVDRGLSGVQLIVSYACRGLVESLAEYLPEVRGRRCVVCFYRNVFSLVPAGVNGISNFPKTGRSKIPSLAGSVVSRFRDLQLRSLEGDRGALALVAV